MIPSFDTATNPYPCLCLCRASLQMMRTIPFRFKTLQFLQTFLTEALTFMMFPSRVPFVAGTLYLILMFDFFKRPSY
jgi:hypothetical protein